MSLPEEISIKISNYKCFGKEEQGFDNIKTSNIIIGKNNSGKSSLLDMIELLGLFNNRESFFINKEVKNNTSLSLSLNFKEEYIPTNLQMDNPYQSSDAQVEFHNNINKPFELFYNFEAVNNKLECKGNLNGWAKNSLIHFDLECEEKMILRLVENDFLKNLLFIRISADRDIKPEMERNKTKVYKSGEGATDIIRTIINRSEYNRKIVQKVLLEELNKIFEPDSSFSEIVVQQINKESEWEIFLEEENKGTIALSQSGSGLKTIILVLINLLIIPKYKEADLTNCIFAFEELENNLHPSLQRRLYKYIHDFCVENKANVFLTTHSNVVIDLFSNEKDAEFYHIMNNNEEAKIVKVNTYSLKKNILDDLEIRASDLLQTNGIIWVEGPSDRTYFNKWVSLFCEDLKEGIHYQCMQYGGRLLSGYTAESHSETNCEEDSIKMLLMNRNSIIIMDSDIREETGEINNTKKRIKEEIEKNGSLCWVTAGKEVENYLPNEAISKYYGLGEIPQVDKYKLFPEYIKNIHENDTKGEKESKKFEKDKNGFAKGISKYFTKENLKPIFDLDEKINKCIEIIKKWNYLD